MSTQLHQYKVLCNNPFSVQPDATPSAAICESLLTMKPTDFAHILASFTHLLMARFSPEEVFDENDASGHHTTMERYASALNGLFAFVLQSGSDQKQVVSFFVDTVEELVHTWHDMHSAFVLVTALEGAPVNTKKAWKSNSQRRQSRLLQLFAPENNNENYRDLTQRWEARNQPYLPSLTILRRTIKQLCALVGLERPMLSINRIGKILWPFGHLLDFPFLLPASYTQPIIGALYTLLVATEGLKLVGQLHNRHAAGVYRTLNDFRGKSRFKQKSGSLISARMTSPATGSPRSISPVNHSPPTREPVKISNDPWEHQVQLYENDFKFSSEEMPEKKQFRPPSTNPLPCYLPDEAPRSMLQVEKVTSRASSSNEIGIGMGVGMGTGLMCPMGLMEFLPDGKVHSSSPSAQSALDAQEMTMAAITNAQLELPVSQSKSKRVGVVSPTKKLHTASAATDKFMKKMSNPLFSRGSTVRPRNKETSEGTRNSKETAPPLLEGATRLSVPSLVEGSPPSIPLFVGAPEEANFSDDFYYGTPNDFLEGPDGELRGASLAFIFYALSSPDANATSHLELIGKFFMLHPLYMNPYSILTRLLKSMSLLECGKGMTSPVPGSPTWPASPLNASPRIDTDIARVQNSSSHIEALDFLTEQTPISPSLSGGMELSEKLFVERGEGSSPMRNSGCGTPVPTPTIGFSMKSAVGATIRLRITNAFKKCIQFFRSDMVKYPQLEEHCRVCIAAIRDMSPECEKLANMLASKLDATLATTRIQREHLRPESTTQGSGDVTYTTLTEMFTCNEQLLTYSTVDQVAAEISGITWQLWSDLSLLELMTGKVAKPGQCPTYSNLLSHFNRVTHWVNNSILRQQQGFRQLEMLSFFILLSEKLLALGDVFITAAVCLTINSAPILRLKKLFSCLPARVSEVYGNTLRVVSPSHHYAGYRAWRDAFGKPYIPYIIMHLGELAAFRELKTWLNGTLINMAKLDKMGALFLELDRCQMRRPVLVHMPDVSSVLVKALWVPPLDLETQWMLSHAAVPREGEATPKERERDSKESDTGAEQLLAWQTLHGWVEQGNPPDEVRQAARLLEAHFLKSKSKPAPADS
mmetsp:Transcript_2757/g.6697  ORF Transcript_2757/g.6697 Transcript_2757/m.6697 type:complete len:1098 (-) Transcript_2757:21-3314(-)